MSTWVRSREMRRPRASKFAVNKNHNLRLLMIQRLIMARRGLVGKKRDRQQHNLSFSWEWVCTARGKRGSLLCVCFRGECNNRARGTAGRITDEI